MSDFRSSFDRFSWPTSKWTIAREFEYPTWRFGDLPPNSFIHHAIDHTCRNNNWLTGGYINQLWDFRNQCGCVSKPWDLLCLTNSLLEKHIMLRHHHVPVGSFWSPIETVDAISRLKSLAALIARQHQRLPLWPVTRQSCRQGWMQLRFPQTSNITCYIVPKSDSEQLLDYFSFESKICLLSFQTCTFPEIVVWCFGSGGPAHKKVSFFHHFHTRLPQWAPWCPLMSSRRYANKWFADYAAHHNAGEGDQVQHSCKSGNIIFLVL